MCEVPDVSFAHCHLDRALSRGIEIDNRKRNEISIARSLQIESGVSSSLATMGLTYLHPALLRKSLPAQAVVLFGDGLCSILFCVCFRWTAWWLGNHEL